MKITNGEMQAILREVEAELMPLLRAEASLSPMGEGSASPAGRGPLGGEASASAGEGSMGSASPAPMMGEKSASPAGMEGSASAGSAGGGDTVAELAEQFKQMPKEELQMVLEALQMALGGGMGGEASASPAIGGEASAPAMGAEKSASPAPMMGKAEASKKAHKMHKEESKEESSKEESSSAEMSKAYMSKSEDRIAALEHQLAVATKAIETLARPMRKALVESAEDPTVRAAAVSGLSKSEVTARLSAAAAQPSLAKSDRALINAFYSGTVPLQSLAHLLVK